MSKPHPRNAPGDFYVVHGCCTACAVWEEVASGLMEWDAGNYPQCFVARQPESAPEIDQMVTAMSIQELDCIRYCGANIHVVKKLVENGEAGNCDRQDVVAMAAEELRPSRWFRPRQRS